MTRLLVLTMVFGVAASGSAQTYSAAGTVPSPHSAVARIVVPERDGVSYGSGTLVAVNESSGLVVTNWHVVRDGAGPIVVYFADGFRSGAYLLRVDRDWDLAALAIRRPNVQPIALSSQAPQPGDTLTIAGYGSGVYRAVTGQCTQYVSPGGDQPFEMIELSAPARNGDSGGPILNNRGELVGTLFGSAFGRTTGSYCGRVRWFLNSASGDFQRVSAQAMLAQQSRTTAASLASINSPGPPADVVPIDASKPLASVAPIGAARPSADQGPANSLRPLGERPWVRASSANSQTAFQTCSAGSVPPPTSRPSPATLAPIPAFSPVTDSEQVSSAPVASLPTPPTGPLPKADQIKAFLALVGVIAVLYHALRFLGWAVG